MSHLHVDLSVLRRAVADSEDLAGHVRGLFGEDEVRSSAQGLTDLTADAGRAADAVLEARTSFADRVEKYASAVDEGSRTIGQHDEASAVAFRKLLDQSIE